MNENEFGKCMECGGVHGYKYDDCTHDGEKGARAGGDVTHSLVWVFLLICLACPPLLLIGVVILLLGEISKY